MQMSSASHAVCPPGEAPGDPQLPLIDHDVMTEWCSDMDRADVLAILAHVPDEAGRALAELDKAIAAADHDRARRAAHRLKGMAVNLGAARLARLARAIEIESRGIGEVVSQMPVLQRVVADTLAALHSYR